MPAVKIFKGLTTRPFASDDMHILCMILATGRAIQFACLVPMLIAFYLRRIKGKDVLINGVPSWCSGYKEYYEEAMDDVSYKLGSLVNAIPIQRTPDDYFWDEFLTTAVTYFITDVTWLIMVWMSASIGTPTVPHRREKYIRWLCRFKMFYSNLFPLSLLVMGIYYVYDMRTNNYGCGDGVPLEIPEEKPWFVVFSALLVTYALEMLVWPAILINTFVRMSRTNCFCDRGRVEGRGGKAERFESRLGCFFRMISCISRGKAGGQDLKNKGELKDFASHAMCLLNNQTNLDLTMTDIYVGMRMLSLIQAENKIKAIKSMASTNKVLKRLSIQSTGLVTDNDSQIVQNRRLSKRPSVLVLTQTKNNAYKVHEHELLQESSESDQATLSDGAHYCFYASYIYVKLPNWVNERFAEPDEECSVFTREPDTLFDDAFRLADIGLGHAMLAYSNLLNGLVETPYSIIVDEETKAIVIAVRGTRSLEDLVIDVQFVPQSLEKVGKVCGFDGEGYYCHKGILARCKFMYNDIKKTRVLKTLYSEQSPFQDYSLVLCGHSLGAGCASILSLMLRPSFPTLKCFAFEPPGCIFDEDLAEMCEEFVTSFVRHDDLVPRLSYHNFESLREGFFEAFTRIKVPKIKLYYHWKVPYSERFVAARNARVLKSKEDISPDTQFNKQLQLFRAERAEKNNSNIQLHLPGKIVHLVDTNGSGNYIPYWADKSDFHSLELSSRMYLDHDIHSLVDILNNICLGEANKVSLAFHNAPLIYTDDEADQDHDDIKLFAWNKLPTVLFVLGVIANALTTAAITGCDFISVAFEATELGFNGTFIDLSFGIFAFEILDISSADHMENAECVAYPPNYTVGGYMKASRVVSMLGNLIGSVTFFMLMISICFIYSSRTWKVITVLALLTALMESLTFLFNREFDFCADDPLYSCSRGSGTVSLAVSSTIWFVISIVSAILVRRRKTIEESPCTRESDSSEASDDQPSNTESVTQQMLAVEKMDISSQKDSTLQV